MPVYEYLCNECGPFTDMRPMAECDDPQDCPRCEGSSPRVILTAPNFFCMPSRPAQGARHQRAQRQRAEDHRPNTRPRTAAGCGCCSGKPSRAGHQDQERRQELSDRAALDDQPLIEGKFMRAASPSRP